jgi:hypothetical protein
MPTSTRIAIPAAAARARRRPETRRVTNGATAMRAAPKSSAPIAAHASTGASVPPSMVGATLYANEPAPIAKNPAASSRSIARPSTRKRIAARMATIVATTATPVSSATRPSGSA